MGFLLAPPEVLILELVVSAAPVNWTLVVATFIGCYVVGFFLLGMGLKWHKIKPYLWESLATNITQAANNALVWLVVLIVFAFGPPLLVAAFSEHSVAVPAATSGETGVLPQITVAPAAVPTTTPPKTPSNPFLSGIQFEQPPNKILLKGRLVADADHLDVYMEWRDGSAAKRARIGELNGTQNEEMTIPIVTVDSASSNNPAGMTVIYWGDGADKILVPSEPSMAQIVSACVILRSNGNEQKVPTLLLRINQNNPHLISIYFHRTTENYSCQ